jgi:hypothetical protein
VLCYGYGNFRNVNRRFSRSLFGRPHFKRYDMDDVAFSRSGHRSVRHQIGAQSDQENIG